MKNYLVTGGLGFIGSHLTEELLKDDDVIVWIIDDGSSSTWNPMKGRIGQTDIRSIMVQLMEGYRFKEDPNNPRLIIISGDCAHRNITTRIRAGMFSGVFHLAADISVTKSIDEPIACLKQNVEKTLQIAKACAEGNTKLVFSSSAAVYGNGIDLACHESFQPFPSNPYGMTKLVVENYLRLYSDLYGLEHVCLRYFNVYGERQMGGSPYAGVIGNWMHSLQWDKPLRLDGDGSQIRDFIHVSDVAIANILAMNTSIKVTKNLNVGTGKGVTLKYLYETISAGLEHEVKREECRKADITCSIADIGQAKVYLKWNPEVTLEEGIKRVLKWRGIA